LRLIDDRRDHVGMGMPGGIYCDPGGAVEELIAVDVLDDRARAARHHEWITTRIRGRDDFAVAFYDRFGFGTREGCLDRRLVHTVMLVQAIRPSGHQALKALKAIKPSSPQALKPSGPQALKTSTPRHFLFQRVP
jgi:hypothetical protein